MHRIDGPGATVDNEFTEGDPVTSVPATVVTDDWLNDVQEELISILTAAGIAPVKGAQDQVLTAIASIIAGSTLNTLDTTRIDVASAATVNLTAAAPNTRHINITGTTTISSFTVAAGHCYFVRFASALTLTNSASLVTQTGANIVTAAGDTCIIRATAANTVEIVSYVAASMSGRNATQSTSDQTAGRVVKNGDKQVCTAWVNFNGTGVVAIRDSYNVSSITDNGTGDYTINFATAMANANYSVSDGVGPNNGSSPEGIIIGAGPSAATDVPPTTAGFRIINIVSATTPTDITRLMLQVFGGR